MFINLSPLYKYRDYRLLYLGQFISWFGNMLTFVALPYQVYHLTHSSLAVGYIGVVQLIPLLITSLWGGALADKVDRRKLLLTAEAGTAIAIALLLFNTLSSSPQLWIIYTVAALASACSGFHRPTLEAITQSLVKHEDMAAVGSLTTFKFSTAMIAGPLLGGFLLAQYDLAVVYFIDVLTFVISLIAIYFIKTPLTISKNEEPIFKSIKSGIRYACSRQELLGSYAVDFVAMVFGMPMALFPAIAEGFHSVSAIGWLYAAPSVGALIASILSGWVEKVPRHGVAISFSAAVWGLAIIAFGFSHHLGVALFFLLIAGAADGVSGLFRITLWNQTIPKNMRGRLAGIEMISYMSGPLLGNTEAGLVAAVFGTRFSVISGGVLCVATVGILAVMLPRFWKYNEQKQRAAVVQH